MKIFISHSSRNKQRARRLANVLIEKGIEVWFDDMDILVGHSIVDKVYEGIKSSDYLAVILTKQSVKSHWVQAELNQARKAEIESGGTTVLPLLFEQCELPECLKEKRYADFRNFEKGMNELLKQLGVAAHRPVFRQVDSEFGREWDSFLRRHKEFAERLMSRRATAIEEFEGDEENHLEAWDSGYVIREAILEVVSRALSEAEALKVATIFSGWNSTITAGWRFVSFLSSKVRNLRTTSDVEKAIIGAIRNGYQDSSTGVSIQFGGGGGSYMFRETMIRANRFASGAMTLDERRSDLARPLRGYTASERWESLCCRKCGMRLEEVFDHQRYSRLGKLAWYKMTCPNRYCPDYGG